MMYLDQRDIERYLVVDLGGANEGTELSGVPLPTLSLYLAETMSICLSNTPTLGQYDTHVL